PAGDHDRAAGGLPLRGPKRGIRPRVTGTRRRPEQAGRMTRRRNPGHWVVGTAAVALLLVPALAALLVFRVVVALVPGDDVPAALAGGALAVVLGLTIVPWAGWSSFALGSDVPGSILANLRPHPGDLTAWAHAADGPLNVLLFVPLGFFLALLLRRPVRAALA